MKSSHKSRRTFLRGLGVTVALPWMESIQSFAATGTNDGAPRRIGFVFMGNGVNVDHWGGKQTEAGLELAKTLSPLESIKDRLTIVSGLSNQTTHRTAEGHYGKMNVLSGLVVKRTTTDVEVGTSVDQLAAQTVGKRTEIPSLVLGTEGSGGGTEAGYATLYSSHISWSSPTTPAPKEVYPRLAFDRLFNSGEHNRRNRGILDSVLEEAKSLQLQLSKHDQHKLNEYLTSVRELEQRVEQAEKRSKVDTNGAGWQPTVTTPNIPRPDATIPRSVEEHMRLMFDIMVLAFQMDKTRVATFMLNNDLSSMDYGFLDGVRGHSHGLSHHGRNPENKAMYQKMNEFNVRMWGEALQKMADTNEGEQSLLDNSMIVLLSSLMDGNAHDSKQLPVVLAGRGGGTIAGGRVLDFSQEENKQLCRLHLSLLDRMGVTQEKFGDAETRLKGLS
ncbi:hypothetical protein ETAA8_21550 [Anatilimnocola aggregata]|uniref:DUF1552 domain-containing protein n=1 Tax=Anatilimnocola aggregata TaxID=2528021 RepID=A0A517YA56_9BACT|nr:DUF1552 domain-containing protein [Anatilimnocola aggregata]QDU27071.1 hypothetical protein ETAA8_21550 [Anatilimnocola aggregata]